MTIMNMITSVLQSIAFVATSISLIFLIKQTRASEKSYQFNCEWQQKNKAAELSKFYKDNVLNQIEYISAVLKQTGVVKKLGNIRDADINDFTEEELFR